MPLYNRKNGISLYYEIIDETNKAGDICLLLGGLTRDHSIWRKLIPYLKKDYQIILFDNRDVGQSSPTNTPYEIAALAEDVADLMNGLNLYPAHIIGHSMGGFIAQHLAAKYPALIKTLVLCSTFDTQTPDGATYLQNRIDLLNKYPKASSTTANPKDIIAVMDKLYAPESLLNIDFVNEIVSHESNNKYPQSIDSFIRQAYACIGHNASLLISDILCPTLILTGEKDLYYPPNLAYKLGAKIKNSTVAIIPNAGHMIQIEQPEALATKFNTFNCHANIEN